MFTDYLKTLLAQLKALPRRVRVSMIFLASILTVLAILFPPIIGFYILFAIIGMILAAFMVLVNHFM